MVKTDTGHLIIPSEMLTGKEGDMFRTQLRSPLCAARIVGGTSPGLGLAVLQADPFLACGFQVPPFPFTSRHSVL